MMSNRMSLPVNVWGFLNEELKLWPDDLRPAVVTAWPAAEPVLVHARAAADFARIAQDNPLPDGSLMTAVLLDPGGEGGGEGLAPEAQWLYFVEVVRPGEWGALRRCFACSQAAQMAAAAFDLPASALAAAESAAATGDWGRLPLAPDVIARLRDDAACRRAFLDALGARLEWRGSLFPAHRKSPWLSIDLGGWWRTSAAGPIGALTGAAARQRDALALLLRGLHAAGLHPTGAAARRRSPGPSAPDGLLALLGGAEAVVFATPYRELALVYDQERGQLAIGGVRGDGWQSVAEFTVELARGDEVLWHGRSTGGEVLVPLAEMEAALQAGADQLNVWPAHATGDG